MLPKESKRLAFLGGTFDPVHQGHIDLAQKLYDFYGFGRLWFVPAAQNPLKTSGPVASSADRLEMLRIAIFDLPMESFGVLDWEITQSGPSFTFDTVQRAVHEFGQPVTIILGNEVFETLPDWKEPALLLKMADVIVVTRDPKLSSDPLAVLQRIGIDDATQNLNLISHSESTRTVEIFSIAALPYSSTTIRQETEKRWESNNLGRPPRGIERGVWEFIKANRLYAVTR